MDEISIIKAEIARLQSQLTNNIAEEDAQLIIDKINKGKRKLEKTSRSEPMIVPIIGASTISEHKSTPKSIFNNDGSVRIL